MSPYLENSDLKPSSKKILTALLSKGYFPKELPLAFTTADFGKHAEEILMDWETSKVFEI